MAQIEFCKKVGKVGSASPSPKKAKSKKITHLSKANIESKQEKQFVSDKNVNLHARAFCQSQEDVCIKSNPNFSFIMSKSSSNKFSQEDNFVQNLRNLGAKA